MHCILSAENEREREREREKKRKGGEDALHKEIVKTSERELHEMNETSLRDLETLQTA